MARSSRSRIKVLIAMEGVLGGTLGHLDYLLRFADPGEFEIHLAVSARRGPRVREDFRRWAAAGWRVHEVAMQRAIDPVADTRALAALHSLCRRERFSVVHTHCAKAGFLGRLAGKMTGARTVHTPHVFPFSHVGSGRSRAACLVMERAAARWTDAFILLSNYQLNVLLEARLAEPERAVIVPNGILPEEFRGPDRRDARRALGLDEAARVVLFAGRFRPQKGLDVLIEAAALMRDRASGLCVVIVGAGPQGTRIEREIDARGLRDLVSVRGLVDHMPVYYAACDLVAMPSRAEGMPYVLLEAKAAGRPAVASLVSGMEEFIEHGVDGVLVPPENPEALAEALERLLAQPSVLAQMGGRARAAFRDTWHAERAAASVYDLYRRLA